MTRRGSELELNDFSGGLHSTAAITELKLNEAYDLSNIVIGPSGDYYRTRYGNTAFNSAAMNSGANVQGLSYFKLLSGSDFLVSVCGNKIFKADDLDGTMDDITGAVSITSGQNNIWTFLTFNNVHIGFGGPATAPDAPIQYTGTGNAAALAGTPPSAYGAVQANNRVFAFRTAAAPSIVQWSILGDGQNWTGTGSGSLTVSTSDNDSVTAMAILSDSVALVFKENSIHKMLISSLVSGSFPVYPLFEDTGCAGKHACVVVGGLCYFITPQGQMKITDGEKIIDESEIPSIAYVDNIWGSGNTSRYQYIQGLYVVGFDYEHIVWLFTSGATGTTNDVALIWDIRNKCWLIHKSGFKANVIAKTQAGVVYTGHYAGIIYKQDVSTSNTDASESSANIDSYWTSGWQKFGSYQKNKGITEAYISFVSQNTGNINFAWGYNFNVFSKSVLIDQRLSGGIIGTFIIGQSLIGGDSDYIRRTLPIGNGNVFQYRIRNTDSRMKINSLSFIGQKFSGVS